MRPRRPLDLTIIFSVSATSAAMGNAMVHSMNDNNPLSGVTVLVVEDDLFLAMALEDTLVTPTTSRWRFLISVLGRIR